MVTMQSLIDRLATTAGVDAWTLSRRRRHEEQRYRFGDRPEASRSIESTSYVATVFNDHDGHQGQASFTVPEGATSLDPAHVERAVFMASLQSNPPYNLPEPATLADVTLADPVLQTDPRAALAELEERVLAAVAGEASVRLSSLELYASRTETRLATSTGVRYARAATELQLDLVVLAGDDDAETESHASHSARRVADLDIEAIVGREARHARDARHAVAPASRRGPVVLANATFLPLLEVFTFATSGYARHREMTLLRVGEPLLGERTVRGDHLTLTSDATLAYGGQSTPFDDEGLSLRRQTIVERGRLRKLAASAQYAAYLDVEATGDWHNRVVAPGTLAERELLDAGDETLLEIVEFSWLNPDPLRGRFATEIRLGYEHGPGGTRVIRGGSLSGNAYDAFADARFARESELRDSYHGPRAIRFGDLQVTGG